MDAANLNRQLSRVIDNISVTGSNASTSISSPSVSEGAVNVTRPLVSGLLAYARQ